MLDKVVANDSVGNLSHIFSGFQLQDFSFYSSSKKPTRGMGRSADFRFSSPFYLHIKIFSTFFFLLSFKEKMNIRIYGYTESQKMCIILTKIVCPAEN